jgi:tetratricopeptide (TPR) repeat protein
MRESAEAAEKSVDHTLGLQTACAWHVKACVQEPNNSKAFVGRGGFYRSLGLFHRALNDYDRAIKLDPGNSSAHLQRAELALLQGDLDKALPSLFALN